MENNAYVAELCAQFKLSDGELKTIAAAFTVALEAGLAGRPSSLKMLPSFIGEPEGDEAGEVLAVDFGGTNVRILRAVLDGRGGVSIKRMTKFPLKAPDGFYDYLSAHAEGEALFDFIAGKIDELAPAGCIIPLGLTFSFPCEQRSLSSAFLIHWTKEIRTRGVEGKDVNELLGQALARRGLGRVRPVAVINDTVGSLLAASYAHPDADMASICGTGHNSCCLEPAHPLTAKPMIVNMESGNFDALIQNPIDREMDRASEMPGRQRLEKMVSGYYLGELICRCLVRMAADGILPHAAQLSERQAVRGMDIDAIIADGAALEGTRAFAEERLRLVNLGREGLEAIKLVTEAVALRSPRLAAASFAGTLLHMDPRMERTHTIAIDGSLYEKMPGYGDNISAALRGILGDKASLVKTVLTKDGSGIGAAIAAAVAVAEV